MGATLADIDRMIYLKFRSGGKSHEEAMNTFPDHVKETVEKELKMTSIENHFGIDDKRFFILLAVVIIGTIIIGLCL